jgi:hypothetical protein
MISAPTLIPTPNQESPKQQIGHQKVSVENLSDYVSDIDNPSTKKKLIFTTIFRLTESDQTSKAQQDKFFDLLRDGSNFTDFANQMLFSADNKVYVARYYAKPFLDKLVDKKNY